MYILVDLTRQKVGYGYLKDILFSAMVDRKCHGCTSTFFINFSLNSRLLLAVYRHQKAILRSKHKMSRDM